MAKLIYNFGEDAQVCTEEALECEREQKNCGCNPLLITAKHLGSLQMMDDDEIKRHAYVLVDEAWLCSRVQAEFLLHVRDIGVEVRAYGIRADANRNPYEGASYLMAWADEIKAVRSGRDGDDNEGRTEEEMSVSPQLMEFLEAETYGEKLDVFKRIRDAIDDDMINTMAVVLDTEIPQGSLESRVESLKTVLETQVRFEVDR